MDMSRIQLSDIAGDIKRSIDCKINYLNGKANEDYSKFYYDLVNKEINYMFPNNTVIKKNY